MNIPLIDLKAHHQALHAEITSAIQNILERTDFILGQDVAKFEEEFAAFCGTKYAVGVSSGVAALELSLLAFGIGPEMKYLFPLIPSQQLRLRSLLPGPSLCSWM